MQAEPRLANDTSTRSICCVMIPNLNDLPPSFEEDRSLRKVIVPVLRALVLLGVLGGLCWLFFNGLEKAAKEEMNVTGGLRAVAEDLWTTGTAREINKDDPDLITELARLRTRAVSGLRIVVVAAENQVGTPVATHELLYLQGQRQVLAVRIFFDPSTEKVDVLSFATSPEFQENGGLR